MASMGPPIYIGGNRHRGSANTVLARKLQWGHRFTSVETDVKGRDLPAGRLASMGPPIYIGGNSTAGKTAIPRGVASMGPPIYIGGNCAT